MFSPHDIMSFDLEREVDSGVESLLNLYLRLAVAHAVVAHVKLDIPRVGELHIGLKHNHYDQFHELYRESPTHKSLES